MNIDAIICCLCYTQLSAQRPNDGSTLLVKSSITLRYLLLRDQIYRHFLDNLDDWETYILTLRKLSSKKRSKKILRKVLL